MFGVDYAWTHPTPAALKAAGVGFVVRYLSTDASKSLTRAEATTLAAAGIWASIVWESTADRMLSGKAAGVADAKAALGQATACGMPSGRPIYFAADFDATAAQQAAINAYLAGAGSVVGEDRVGIYGGFYVVQRALNAGAAKWAWQTMAWSGGQWDSRAQIRQTGLVTIGGVQCDRNEAMTSDYGQWMPGKTPEEDMPITTADAKTLLTTDGVIKSPTGATVLKKAGIAATNTYVTEATAHEVTMQNSVEANLGVAALTEQVTALKAELDTVKTQLATFADPAGFAAQVVTAVKSGLAGIKLDVEVGP